MPLVPGPIFVTNSPAVARVIDAAVSLWLKKYAEAGYPEGPTPQWVFDVQAELHTLAYGAPETLGNGTAPKKGPPVMLTTVETAERLGVTRQVVTKWCRNGHVVGIRDGRSWLVDSRSVDALEEKT